MDLKEIDIPNIDITTHWYYTSKAKAMTHLLRETIPLQIVDVGAGSGFFSRYLLSHTPAKEAWCIDISYENDSEQSESGKPIHYQRSIDLIDADLVLMMDVLEHVNDDVKLLREYVIKAPHGSQFLITVPAFQFLWSGHDDFLEHKRRYTLKHLQQIVCSADLNIKHMVYYYGAVFPIAATLRLLQKAFGQKNVARSQLTKHRPIVNRALESLCNAELRFMNCNRIGGLTLFCLAQKP